MVYKFDEIAGSAVRVYVRLVLDLLFCRVQLIILYIAVPCLIFVCDYIYKYCILVHKK